MGCACNGGNDGPTGVTTQYEVRLPDGSVKIVDSETAAKIEVTAAGGGTYSRR